MFLYCEVIFIYALDSTEKSNTEDDSSVSKESDETVYQRVGSLEQTINNSNVSDLSEIDSEETVDTCNSKLKDDHIQPNLKKGKEYSKEKSLEDEVFSEMVRYFMLA